MFDRDNSTKPPVHVKIKAHGEQCKKSQNGPLAGTSRGSFLRLASRGAV